MKILRDNASSEYGRKYGFDRIGSLADYRRQVPLSNYNEYYDDIIRMMKGGGAVTTSYNIRYYTRSSGTTGQNKVLPITDEWMDLYLKFSYQCTWQRTEMHYGEHFGGRVFLTNEMHITTLEEGVKSLLASGTAFARQYETGEEDFSYCTSPTELLFPDTDQDISYLKLLFALRDADVIAVIGVYGHHLLQLLDVLKTEWRRLTEDIRRGEISDKIDIPEDFRKTLNGYLSPDPARADELVRVFEQGFDDPILPRIWPKLRVVMAITGSTFREYQAALKTYAGSVPYHCFIYAATEGFFGTPRDMGYEAEYILTPRTGFFEFIPAGESEEKLLEDASQLKKGERYELVYTSFTGLYRYRMGDVVEVVDFYDTAPVIKVCYRVNQQINVAGEKMNTANMAGAVREYMEAFGQPEGSFCVYPDMRTLPGHYLIFIEPEGEKPANEPERIDALLRAENYDYADCRNLGEIGLPEIRFLKKGTFLAYKQRMAATGQDMAQYKPVRILDDEKLGFFTEQED